MAANLTAMSLRRKWIRGFMDRTETGAAPSGYCQPVRPSLRPVVRLFISAPTGNRSLAYGGKPRQQLRITGSLYVVSIQSEPTKKAPSAVDDDGRIGRIWT